ncbi:uncharacterized protein LOC143027877 [Oratosquilla oratoria]|uniref:uncharacterized protein LOC143027877 n=1 Tax=Oratosquilla oratoria TaxID=337810 RepID=UPI003F75C45A
MKRICPRALRKALTAPGGEECEESHPSRKFSVDAKHYSLNTRNGDGSTVPVRFHNLKELVDWAPKCLIPPAANVSLFIDEFEPYLETIDMVSTNIIVWGDFNLWLDDTKARYVQLFIETVAMFNLINILDKSTSMCGHIIDLVLVDTSSDLVRDLYVDDVCSLSPVHKLVSFNLALALNRKQVKEITFLSTRNMDYDTLLLLICDKINEQQSDLCSHSSRKISECPECLYTIYNSVVREEYEKMYPLTSKKIVVKEDSLWFSDEIRRAKNDKKKKERLWRRQQTDQRRVAYTQARNYEKKLISRRKRDFYKGKIEQAGPNMHKLYKVLDNLTGNKKKHKLPEGYSDSELANKFLYFFDKITRIISTISNNNSVVLESEQTSEIKLTAFQTVSESTVKDVIEKAKFTYSANDPMPISLLHGMSDMRGILNRGECRLLILLDLSAAFDMVVHDVLLRVCEHIGIEGAALSYLKSYLEGRTYCVQIVEHNRPTAARLKGLVPSGEGTMIADSSFGTMRLQFAASCNVTPELL